MEAQDLTRRIIRSLHRREPLQAGLAAARRHVRLASRHVLPARGAESGPPKHGGILRVRGPFGIAWEADFPLYRTYAIDSSWNAAYVNDPTLAAMLKEQRRTKDLEGTPENHLRPPSRPPSSCPLP